MAPKAAKAEKVTADQGNTMIVEYLKAQNRPYSALDISTNLHNKVTKAYATKALKELHDSKIVAGKASGKQIVYHAVQDESDAISVTDLAHMDSEIAALQQTITTLKANEKLLRSNLASVNASMSTEELDSKVSSLEVEKTTLLARLAPLRKGDVKPFLPEEKTAIEGQWTKWKRIMERRRKMALDLWALGTEEMPEGKTKEELWEELGLEEDN